MGYDEILVFFSKAFKETVLSGVFFFGGGGGGIWFFGFGDVNKEVRKIPVRGIRAGECVLGMCPLLRTGCDLLLQSQLPKTETSLKLNCSRCVAT